MNNLKISQFENLKMVKRLDAGNRHQPKGYQRAKALLAGYIIESPP